MTKEEELQRRYDNGEFTWEDGFIGKLRMVYEFFTILGKGMMNNDKDNPTAEVMAGEEGRGG